MRVFAVLGLGEAGSLIAAGLVRAGAVVRGFDPLAGAPDGVLECASDAEAAAGADVVLALTSAQEAVQTLSLALPGAGPDSVYADLNTGPAGLKLSLAAAVIEALRAGRAAGCEDWLRADIGQVLADASAATVDRLEQGSAQHARRRTHEMMAAGDLLDELGVPSRVTRATQAWLEQLMSEAEGEPGSG